LNTRPSIASRGARQHEELRARGVADVDHRPPLGAVAHQRQHPVLPGAVGHAVDREVEAHARTVSVDRGLAQHDDAEILACQGSTSRSARAFAFA
jgi:hypothetical protein